METLIQISANTNISPSHCWPTGIRKRPCVFFFFPPTLQSCQTAKHKLPCPPSEKELSFLSFHCLAKLQNFIKEIVLLVWSRVVFSSGAKVDMGTQIMRMKTVL